MLYDEHAQIDESLQREGLWHGSSIVGSMNESPLIKIISGAYAPCAELLSALDIGSFQFHIGIT